MGIKWLLKNHRNLIDAEHALNEGGEIGIRHDGKPVQSGVQTSEKVALSYRSDAYVATILQTIPHRIAYFDAHVCVGSSTLDGDGSNTVSRYDGLTDGLLILRYAFGLTGASLTSRAVAAGAPRSDPLEIKSYLDAMRPALDVDGNGVVDALTDGLIMLRYMFGLRGQSLIANALGIGARRTAAADIETYIRSLMP